MASGLLLSPVHWGVVLRTANLDSLLDDEVLKILEGPPALTLAFEKHLSYP